MILVTGASGNVGSEVARQLQSQGLPFRAACRDLETAQVLGFHKEALVLDFGRPETFAEAFQQVKQIFLMRPPELTDAQRYFAPFIQAAKDAGVQQIVFLSVEGAEKNSFLPHHKIEALIRQSGIPFTFLRPGFFMQNLSTTHAPEIKELGDVFVPAGKGRTNFIDVRDIAAAVVKTLMDPKHYHRSYTLTGDEALTYQEVATILSEELGRPIRYSNPSAFRFFKRMRARGFSVSYTLVMIVIYTIAKLGAAGQLSSDLRSITGRPAIRFRQFVKDFQKAWGP